MIVYIGADSILLYSGAFSPVKTDERMVTMHDHEKEPIGHALHVLDTTMRRYIDTYSHKKEHESLTGTNTWVIQFIADHKDGPVYLRDIERRFGITRSTASKVVDMLVRNGFVERHTGETDARLRRLTLTAKSENLLADIRADHEAMEAVLTKGFTQNEKETMLFYLRRAKINVDAAFAEKQQKKERSGADG